MLGDEAGSREREAGRSKADGIRSSEAHDKKHHPLDQAHTAVATPTGALVYVVCGWQGCAQRLKVDAAVWEAELARRAREVAEAFGIDLEAVLARTFGAAWRDRPLSMADVCDACEAELLRRLAPPATGHPTPAAGSTD